MIYKKEWTWGDEVVRLKVKTTRFGECVKFNVHSTDYAAYDRGEEGWHSWWGQGYMRETLVVPLEPEEVWMED